MFLFPRWEPYIITHMNVISRRALRKAVSDLPPSQQPAAETAYSTWYSAAKSARWDSYADVKQTFNTADQVGGKLVFDIGGNKYRIVALPAYRTKRLMILFAGTHKEYDKLDVSNM